ncbi:MAG: FlgD immunoglobulin-like domain containing protein [Candidatus Eisenbacteria bacterium]
MNAIFESYAGQVAPIRIHVYWPSPLDPMFLWNPVDAMNRRNFYGVNYVPTLRFDGRNLKDLYDFPDEDAFYEYFRSTVDSLLAVPSPLRIEADQYRTDDSVFVSFDVIVEETMSGGQQIYLVATESVVEVREGTFHYPMRDFVITTDEMYLRLGDSLHFDWSYAIPDSAVDPDGLVNHVFVQQTSNKRIRQGWSAPLRANDVSVDEGAVPLRLVLGPNAPNPFNPSTTIRYVLPEPGDVSLSVHGVSGRLIATLARGRMPAGEHSVTWDGRDRSGAEVPSGVYFTRLEKGAEAISRKITLIR